VEFTILSSLLIIMQLIAVIIGIARFLARSRTITGD
jgi:Na+/H+-dicarboxylate symporter